MVESEDWITTEEASRLSGFHVEHIRELARDGIIRGKKWGRSWMINKSSLMQYLSLDRKTGPKTKSPQS